MELLLSSNFWNVADKIGTITLLLFYVVALNRGWIVTKREHEETMEVISKDRDNWKEVAFITSKQNTKLLIGAEVSAAVLKSLPSAMGDDSG